MDDLDVGHVRTRIGRTVGGPGGRDRVERVAHGPVADCVEVRLETEGVDPRHHIGEDMGVDEVDAAVGGRRTCAIQVRVEHRRGEVLDDPVEQQLDARRPEAAERAPLPVLAPRLDLVDATPSIPPVGGDDARGQPALLREPAIGLDHRRQHPGVLPGGDPELVKLALGVLEPDEQVLFGIGRHQPFHELCGTLVQRSRRRAVRVAFDPAIGRVGGCRRDAGELEGARVDPDPVPVAVREVDQPVRDDAVEVLGAGRAAREVVQRPAAARDPLHVGIARRVVGDGGEVGVETAEVVEVAAKLLQPGLHRVDVGILEPGRDGPSAELHHARPGTDMAADVLVAADGDDPSVADRERIGTGARRNHGAQRAPEQDEVGRGGGIVRHRGSLPDGAVRRSRSRPARRCSPVRRARLLSS